MFHQRQSLYVLNFSTVSFLPLQFARRRNRTLNLPFDFESFICCVPSLCTLILLYIYILTTILPFQIKIAMKNFAVYCCTYVPQVISNGEFFGDLIQSFIKFTPLGRTSEGKSFSHL
jgi:hypothetical protein